MNIKEVKDILLKLCSDNNINVRGIYKYKEEENVYTVTEIIIETDEESRLEELLGYIGEKLYRRKYIVIATEMSYSDNMEYESILE